MPNKYADLTGQTFGALIVLQRVTSNTSMPAYECQCACGERITRAASWLVSGRTLMCPHCRVKRSDAPIRSVGRPKAGAAYEAPELSEARAAYFKARTPANYQTWQKLRLDFLRDQAKVLARRARTENTDILRDHVCLNDQEIELVENNLKG